MRGDRSGQRPPRHPGPRPAGPGRGRGRHGRARAGRIVYAGPETAGPSVADAEIVNCEGRWITPGLIDCTPIWSTPATAPASSNCGWGASYEEIARGGGGILSTVTATRGADEGERSAPPCPARRAAGRGRHHGRDQVRLRAGIVGEMRMLRAARALGTSGGWESRPRSWRCTPCHRNSPATRRYIDLVGATMLQAVAAEGLADAVDAFCEGIAFRP